MVPDHSDRAADTERHAQDHQQTQPANIDAKALRGFFAERQRAEGIALAHQNDGAGSDERQRQHDMTKTAVLQRAEQPERDLQHHEWITRQIHHQRRHRASQTRNRQPRENEDQQARIAAGDGQKQRIPMRTP